MYDIAIIGAGPAGASAAIFTAKAGKKTLLIDNDKSMTKRAWIENHLGLPDGMTGPDFVEAGKTHAKKFGAELVVDTVTGVARNESGFTLNTESGQTYEARYVIIATGAAMTLAEAIGLKLKDATEPRIKTVIDVDKDGRTSEPGIWAAGTAAGVSVHTIITAGDGAKVAINILSEMNGERYVDHDVMKS
jgi:thioredoxin reductase